MSLQAIADWPVGRASALVIAADGAVVEARGDLSAPYRLASIAKLLTVYACLIGTEEEAVATTDPAGPPGSTLAHLMSHASGLGFDVGDPTLSQPEQRRVYSNAGIEAAADHLHERTGITFADYLGEAVLTPLGMADTSLRGSPAHGIWSTAADLGAFVAELWNPRLLSPATLQDAIDVKFPGLNGVVPGVGRFDPCDWGYGFERNFGRPRHWAGQSVSEQAFGHFGGAGTFLWVDPVHGVAAVCLTDRPFDSWALQVWPTLCDEIIARYGAASGSG